MAILVDSKENMFVFICVDRYGDRHSKRTTVEQRLEIYDGVSNTKIMSESDLRNCGFSMANPIPNDVLAYQMSVAELTRILLSG